MDKDTEIKVLREALTQCQQFLQTHHNMGKETRRKRREEIIAHNWRVLRSDLEGSNGQ